LPSITKRIFEYDRQTVISNFKFQISRYYRKNTALIEIYYEQLNYEKLKETPGYTVIPHKMGIIHIYIF
jgi:hypothetical protein